MNNTDLISIVIPVYNVEKYLDECIQSVLSQSYSNIEVILVNDGSTDNSLKICHKYNYDDRVLIIDKKNEGLSSARQAGMNNVHGEYLCTIDSDDYLDKDYIKKMYLKISSSNADICLCARSDIYLTNEEYNNQILKVGEIEITNDKLVENYSELATNYKMSDSWNKLYRTSFVKNTGLKFELDNIYNGTDLLFNYCILLHKPRIVVLNEPLYKHRILLGSRTNRRNKQLQKGFMIILERMHKEVKKLGFGKSLDRQLSLIYLTLQWQVVSDIYNENQDLPEILRDKIKDFNKEHVSFINKHDYLSLRRLKTNSLFLGVFKHCINSNSIKSITLYLKVFNKLKQTKNYFIKRVRYTNKYEAL